MSMAAIRSMPTKTSIEPRAVFHLQLGIDVQKGTLFICTSFETRIKITLGHLGHVELVQKFTHIALKEHTISKQINMIEDY